MFNKTNCFFLECYTGDGSLYRGSVSETELGTQCLKWTKSAGINPETHPNKVSTYNYSYVSRVQIKSLISLNG